MKGGGGGGARVGMWYLDVYHFLTRFNFVLYLEENGKVED